MENTNSLVPISRRIIPETDFGVQGKVELNGQLFFVYDFQFEGLRRQILLPQSVMWEMESCTRAKPAELEDRDDLSPKGNALMKRRFNDSLEGLRQEAADFVARNNGAAD